MAWDSSVQLVLNWLEVFRNMEGDFLGLSWLGFRSSVSLKCVLSVTPSDDCVDVRWENWCYSSITRLLADVHGDFAGRHFG